jgi:glycosyltransferase involved in cell wall biosynthesis
MKIKIVYFFRKPFTDYFSIEELFKFIQTNLPDSVDFQNFYMKKMSTGLYNRIYNCFEVISKQGEINHITGDVHYISYFMKKNKTVLTVHDLVPLTGGSYLKRAIIKFFWYTLPAKRVKYITVISEFTKQELLKHVKVNPEKVIVIHDCVSPLIKFTPKEFNTTKPNILQVGTAHNKNLENVIPAINGMNVKFSIIGNLKEHQKKLLEEYKIDYENHFNLDYEDVVRQYQKADMVVFTSKYEGFGLPIVEANGIGRPIITSNLASMPEVAGDAALIVDPFNIDEIREAIRKIINDVEFRNDLIENGKRNVKRFKPREIAQKYADFYYRMMEEMK